MGCTGAGGSGRLEKGGKKQACLWRCWLRIVGLCGELLILTRASLMVTFLLREKVESTLRRYGWFRPEVLTSGPCAMR